MLAPSSGRRKEVITNVMETKFTDFSGEDRIASHQYSSISVGCGSDCRTSSAPFRSAEDFPKSFCRKWPLTLVYVFSGLKFKAPRVQNLRASSFIKFLLREYVSWVKPKFWFEFRQLFVKQCYLSDELFLTNAV